MPRKIVLLSGSVASGKTTLVERLRTEFEDVYLLKTKDTIRELAAKTLRRELEAERRAMQEFGDRLDRETKGQWVREALRKEVSRLAASKPQAEPQAVFIVDAVRIPLQIKAIREAYGYIVIHIHLRAPAEVLKERYKSRASGLRELRSFSEVARNKTEARVTQLERIADVVIDTRRCLPDDVLVRAASYLGLYSRSARGVDVLVGGQFGSEGHRQLPSGTLRNPLAQLVIAPGAVLNPDVLMKEIIECKVDVERLAIDPQAMIIAAKDISAEKNLVKRIGSTGQGVGMASARRIVDRGKRVILARDIRSLRPFIKPTWKVLEKAYANGCKIMVEGTQGCGLSLYHGDYPFVTSRDTTVGGCLSEAGISPSRIRKVVMVCRSYPIRVESPEGSTSGEFSQEISWSTIADRSGINLAQLEKAERTSTTKRLLG